MEDIYEPLDEGIREVVELLRENGVDTFSSCEGGKGHAFQMPTVRINGTSRKEEKRVSKILKDNGYSGFYVGTRWASSSNFVQGDVVSFIEVEFWVLPVVRSV